MPIRGRSIRRAAVAALGALAVAAGCTYSPHPASGKLQCGPSGECPSGYVCRLPQDTCFADGAPIVVADGGLPGTDAVATSDGHITFPVGDARTERSDTGAGGAPRGAGGAPRAAGGAGGATTGAGGATTGAGGATTDAGVTPTDAARDIVTTTDLAPSTDASPTVSRYLGVWTFVSPSTITTTCGTNTPSVQDLSGDQIEIDLPLTAGIADLESFYICDIFLDVVGGSAQMNDPNPYCPSQTATGGDPTFFFSPNSFTFSTSDGHTATHSASYDVEADYMDGTFTTCTSTITGHLTQ